MKFDRDGCHLDGFVFLGLRVNLEALIERHFISVHRGQVIHITFRVVCLTVHLLTTEEIDVRKRALQRVMGRLARDLTVAVEDVVVIRVQIDG